jgi:hypothetical protein
MSPLCTAAAHCSIKARICFVSLVLPLQVLGAIGRPPSDNTLQIGSTPKARPSILSWRCSSMNFTSVAMGGRAPRCSSVKPQPASCGVSWMGLPALSVRRRHGVLRNGVGDAPAEQPDSFAPGLATGLHLVQVGPTGPVGSALGDSDHMQGSVGQPVPAPVEPHLALAGT